ncbi:MULTISPECIES: hypothetical protein [Rhizobium]|uniref:Uncharacterized protein n=1 Tax=Rhizobium aouanii TaxID=3118145 RepID=A0ABU8CJ24_9HYPH|nr:hypothetical protein [Rhizobium acaciae]MCW1410743.1 hypothetical protein [Rhizobium acaciae]MCW1742958.1 hypothetical protein [Rhizobium acaciae]MCW1750154.1 hypothetical protein [Rhizobium acaciae]
MSQPVTPDVETKNRRLSVRFFDELKGGVAKYLAAGVIGLIGIGASWLWGWYAAGGPSNLIGAVPRGAVVAFDRADGCPTGWDDYKEGWGRFVIGAVESNKIGQIPGEFVRDASGVDLGPREFRKPGGQALTAITVRNLPAFNIVGHDEYVRSQKGYAGLESVTPVDGPNLQNPLSNLPPYIALVYCKKSSP